MLFLICKTQCLSLSRFINFIRLLILLTLVAVLSIIKINIYHSQDQENKFQMEKSNLKRTYEKKVIYLWEATFETANDAIKNEG